jgi:UDP:flavonoid glycosyltransferase YjiC (YdhE family)
MRFLYFVSGHGFGHISRSSVVIKELLNRGHRVTLVSSRIGFLDSFTHQNLNAIDYVFDFGLAQSSSLAIDFVKTVEDYEKYQSNKSIITRYIEDLIQKEEPAMLVSDCASLPLSVGSSAGISSTFIGNFTWDFIYRHYKTRNYLWSVFANQLSQEYANCKLAFELPFSCPMDSLQHKVKIGLIGREPKQSRKQVRSDLHFNDKKKYLLLSFGAYGLDFSKLQLKNIPKGIVLIIPGLPGTPSHSQIQQIDCDFPNLLQACDAVLTKPGYGILAEAHASKTPVIYTDRGDFIEYPYLVEAMKQHHRSTYISQQDLYSMNIEASLEKVLKQNPNEIKQIKSGLMDLVNHLEQSAV